ncbi:MAG: MoxR family ATPase [Acidimicrobiia bacterium]|nr:MoxR family ATPase [Acidimicrobiia bacterium]
MTEEVPSSPVEPLAVADGAELCHRIVDRLETVVVGKRPALELVLSGLLAGGHVLLEDLPGLGKTLVARSLAQVMGLTVGRIQFTPDLMPADVTGSLLYDQRRQDFEFRPGPIFNNVVLGDEINRAPPKTQAALLEAMQERQVTVDGVSHRLPDPFVVLATQNPVEFEGTYPLPEAQVDRFMLRTSLGYPSEDDEAEIIRRRLRRGTDEIVLEPVVGPEEVRLLQACLETVTVAEGVIAYAVAIVRATRASAQVQAGASPRGVDSLVKLARARALLARRDYVLPDDLKALAEPALAHRLVLRPELWVRGIDGTAVVSACLDDVPTPPTVPEGPVAPTAAVDAALEATGGERSSRG